MTSMLITTFLAVLGRMAGRLITTAFFEGVLIDVILWVGDRLVKMTSNDLDDVLMAQVRAALAKTPPQVQPAPATEFDYSRAISLATERRDYFEAARLMNERDGISQ
jgi:hypothetical protein